MIYQTCVILVMALAYVTHGQYYQALNTNSFELNFNSNGNGVDDVDGPRAMMMMNDDPTAADIDNYIETKYVNSGQSIVLICDLPNNMPDGKVLFIKYDKKSFSSGVNIRDDNDDERFEIGQQYAWEWSLKINFINEDDSGVYFCKVGNKIIKKFEIVVRVPPRIKDDPAQSNKIAREGSNVEFACFSAGTPKPNITWYLIGNSDQTEMEVLPNTGTYLRLDNVTRFTPRRYQCRASNGIPPSDTRNLTLTVEFAPEIEIQARYNPVNTMMNLNCTVRANPLTNSNFWRKDGNYITNGIKYQVNNLRLDEYTVVSILYIKYYDETDQGLYECTAENDIRVSKIVYNLREDNLIPIGSTSEHLPNSNGSSNNQKTKKTNVNNNNPMRAKSANNNNNNNNNNQSHRRNKQGPQSADNAMENMAYEHRTTTPGQYSPRKHLRNHRNQTRPYPVVQLPAEKVIDQVSIKETEPTSLPLEKYTTEKMQHKSPFIILINEDSNNGNSADDTSIQKKSTSYLNQQVQNQATRSELSFYGLLLAALLVSVFYIKST